MRSKVYWEVQCEKHGTRYEKDHHRSVRVSPGKRRGCPLCHKEAS